MRGMLMAMTTDQILMDAQTVPPDQQLDFFCPACKEKVFLKRGVKKAAHFCHYKTSTCQSFSEGETPTHLAGKRFLYDFMKQSGFDVTLEAYLPEINQRPDLLVKKAGQVVAIEFQCSPISIEKINQRTRGFQSAGYKVVWILGPPLHIRSNFLPIHLAMVNDQVVSEANILSLDLNQSQVFIHYGLHSKALGRVDWQTGRLKQFALNQSLPLRQLPSADLKIKDYNSQLKQLRRQHYHRSKSAQNFFQALYESGDHLYHLPREIFKPCAHDWAILTPAYQWKYYLLSWLEGGQVISLGQVKAWLEEESNRGRIKLATTPGLRGNMPLRPVEEFLKSLFESGYLQIHPSKVFKVSHKLPRYDLTLS